MNCPTCKTEIPTTKYPVQFMCPKCGAQAKLYPSQPLQFGKRCTVQAVDRVTRKSSFLISIQGVSYPELMTDRDVTVEYLERKYPGYIFPGLSYDKPTATT